MKILKITNCIECPHYENKNDFNPPTYSHWTCNLLSGSNYKDRNQEAPPECPLEEYPVDTAFVAQQHLLDKICYTCRYRKFEYSKNLYRCFKSKSITYLPKVQTCSDWSEKNE